MRCNDKRIRNSCKGELVATTNQRIKTIWYCKDCNRTITRTKTKKDVVVPYPLTKKGRLKANQWKISLKERRMKK